MVHQIKICMFICFVLIATTSSKPTLGSIRHGFIGSFGLSGGLHASRTHQDSLDHNSGFINQGQSSGGHIREGSYREGSFRESNFDQGSHLNAANNHLNQGSLNHGSFVSNGQQFETNGGLGISPGFVGGIDSAGINSGSNLATGSVGHRTGLEASVGHRTGLEASVGHRTGLEASVGHRTGLEVGVGHHAGPGAGVGLLTGLGAGVGHHARLGGVVTGLGAGVGHGTKVGLEGRIYKEKLIT